MLSAKDIEDFLSGRKLAPDVICRNDVLYTSVNSSDLSDFCVDLYGAVQTAHRGPEFIIGNPFDSDCLKGVSKKVVNKAPVSVLELDDARVVGRDAFLSSCDSLIDFSGSKLIDDFIKKPLNKHKGYIWKHRRNSLSITYRAPHSGVQPKGVGIVVHGVESGNYGSFLFRMLPQLLILSRYAIDRIDYIVVPERTPWLMSALLLLRLDHLCVYEFSEICGVPLEKFFAVGQTDVEGSFHPNIYELIDEFSDFTGSTATDDFEFSKKVYLSRNLSKINRPNYRPLINEDEVERSLMDLGFSIAYPETLSFSQQIRLMRNAEFVVGPSGSGMLNSVFSRPGVKVVDIESFTHTVRQHAHIYDSTEKKYGFVFGDLQDVNKPIFSPWTVESNHVLESIDLMAGV
ncbi:Protein of unknown function [Microbulbifer donghaiensis]|uniref:Glycosyltransferase 61 catalytic domain-containing protein n=1 Tax=Microbulbifer donghaiensis TaxID=494016 RepID=A0A1M5CKF6_9GAMM|nr:glycosyltransferase 61 family protein [Microbulbifer donghaiensis]SHF55087.1 Protein of unknown function [Microbulbifer donghaiensis]